MAQEKWNAKFNPDRAQDHPSGQTTWLTVVGLVATLFVRTTLTVASLAFTFQRLFEFQTL
jgi:hypothetical protein